MEWGSIWGGGSGGASWRYWDIGSGSGGASWNIFMLRVHLHLVLAPVPVPVLVLVPALHFVCVCVCVRVCAVIPTPELPKAYFFWFSRLREVSKFILSDILMLIPVFRGPEANSAKAAYFDVDTRIQRPRLKALRTNAAKASPISSQYSQCLRTNCAWAHAKCDHTQL